MLFICLALIVIIIAVLLMFFLNIASRIIVRLCLIGLAVYGIYTLVTFVKRKLRQRRIDRNTPSSLDITCRCGRIFRAAAPSGAADYSICCPYCGTLCHVTLRGRHKSAGLTDEDKRSIVISAAGILALILLMGLLFENPLAGPRYYTAPNSGYEYNFTSPTENPDII